MNCASNNPGRFVWKVGLAGVVAVTMTLLISASGCAPGSSAGQVVVYTSQDQVFAEPILRRFEQESGIKVRAVYDSEAVKTVGLANRLLAERTQPRCDVFWSNEELRTWLLAAEGVFAEARPWTAFGFRTRRLVVNTNLVPLASAPGSWSELTNKVWSGKIALAYPLFGTTATHFLAWRQRWGDEEWQKWCRALQANKPLLVDGNSMVVNLVGRGEAAIGFTDFDDILAGQRSGAPVAALPLSIECLLIPNTVAVVRKAPHPAEAEQLEKYLRSSEVVKDLVAVGALEGARTDEVSIPTLKVRWELLIRELESATSSLKRIFLR
jgi:iron(III) transport system substrate-binding protein